MKRRRRSILAWTLLLAGCQGGASESAIADATLAEALASDVATSDGSQTQAPRLFLTFNELPSALNGSETYSWNEGADLSFMPRSNLEGLTIDLMLDSSSGPVDWAHSELSCEGVPMDPDRLEIRSEHHARVRFSKEEPFPGTGPSSCTCVVRGPGGEDAATVSLDVAALPPHLDPFVTPDLWLVILSRDLFELQVTPLEDGTYWVVSVYAPAGNGINDLDEAIEAIGLASSKSAAAAATARDALLSVVRAETRAIFGLDASGQMDEESVPVTIFFEGDAGAPLITQYDGKSFSMIALGGDGTPEEQPTGLVGRALIDPHNQDQENNTTYGLGVYPSAIIRQVLELPIGALALAPILPDVGVPMGEHPLDEQAMEKGFELTAGTEPELAERHQLYRLVVDLLGQAIAATLAHEIGHSMGLVPPGPPPEGLFAQMPGLDLVEHHISGWHIDTPGLNIMQTGAVTNWLEAVGQEMRFGPLNLAYLRRRLVVGPLAP